MNILLLPIGALFAFLFVYGEKPYLSSAAVSPDGTEVAAVSMQERHLYVYSCDGQLKWDYALSSAETAGGQLRVFYLDGYVTVYSVRKDTLFFFDSNGTKLWEEPTDVDYSEDCFVGWEHKGATYRIHVGDCLYEYYSAYFPVRFGGKERYLAVTGPDGVQQILWTTG